MTAWCLRILQAALVYVNTLMLQEVLAEPEHAALLTDADRRGLTPLFWLHIRPYGEVHLDIGQRLAIGGESCTGAAPAAATGPARLPRWHVEPGVAVQVRRHLEHGQQGPDLGLAAAPHDNRFGAAVEAGASVPRATAQSGQGLRVR